MPLKSATPPFWIGLDLGSQETHVCIIDNHGDLRSETSVETSFIAITDAVGAVPAGEIALIAVEAGCEIHIIRKLRASGLPIAMFETRKARRFLSLRQNKTDCNDARGLADMGRLGQKTVSQVYLKSLECQKLRGELALRKSLVSLRVKTENILRARLAMNGVKMRRPRKPGTLHIDMEAQLLALKLAEGIDLRREMQPLVDICDSLHAYLDQLDRDLAERADRHPVCRRLMSVPGVGPITALSFYSTIEDPTRFNQTTAIGPYLGLVPKRHQSGKLAYMGRITKAGNPLTRSNLFQAAVHFHRYAPDCDLKAWSERLTERTGKKRARIALARKLAILLLTLWKTDADFELRRTQKVAGNPVSGPADGLEPEKVVTEA